MWSVLSMVDGERPTLCHMTMPSGLWSHHSGLPHTIWLWWVAINCMMS